MGGPIFNSYNVRYTLSGSCTGSITNVVLEGGVGPYSFQWLGAPIGTGYPITYTAATSNIHGLCTGSYSGTVTDMQGSATTEVIEVGEIPNVSLSATVVNNGCTISPSQFCSIRVHRFTHTQPEVRYELYRDGIITQKATYLGSGNHPHLFENLRTGSYTLTAYDGNIFSYVQTAITGCTTGDANTGAMSAATIVENWDRWAVWGQGRTTFDNTNYYGTGLFDQPYFFTNFKDGDGGYYVTGGNFLTDEELEDETKAFEDETAYSDSDVILESDYAPTKSGEASTGDESRSSSDSSSRSDDTALENNYAPYFWFYTGTTFAQNGDDRLTDNSKQWFYQPPLSEQASYEGEDLGPSGVAKAVANWGSFYYSTKINRFVILQYTALGGTNYEWATFRPTRDQGRFGNPTAADTLTDNTQWGCADTTADQYTVSGAPQVVVSAVEKYNAKDHPDLKPTRPGSCMIQGTANTGVANGFISSCAYLNYTHEVTLGSTMNDNDSIGVVLCWFRDTEGDYGPKGTSHSITATLGNQNNSNPPRLTIGYNTGHSTYAFRSIDLEQPWNSSFSNTVGSSLSTYTTAGSQYFRDQGFVRMRIKRSGTQGENFFIEMTDTMGNTGGIQTNATKNIGDLNPYNSANNFSFSLLDPTTWSGNTTTAQDYVTGKELVKFIGSQKYGYYVSSQGAAQFFDIAFSGYQTNFIPVATQAGASESGYFELFNSTTVNTDHSDTSIDNWNKHFGGGYPGIVEVPVIKPTVSVQMQTFIEPDVIISGATKINYPSSQYAVYYCDDIEDVPLTLTWVNETVEMRTNKSYGKYSVFPYVPEAGEFLSKPLVNRMFDNTPIVVSGATGLFTQASDNLPISYFPCQDYWEYCIKPSSIFKDRVDKIYYTGCKSNVLSGTTNTWYDTLDLNRRGNEQYGIYDRNKDYYLILVSRPTLPIIRTANFAYANEGPCEVYNQQVIAMSASTTAATGSLIVSGRTWVTPLNYPCNGQMQVTVNGLTLFKATDRTMDDGDFWTDGQTLSIRKDTLEEDDLINIFYVPNSTYRSHYTQYITVPGTITSADTSNLYYNGIYYMLKLDEEPLGAVGMVLNGTVLYGGADFEVVGSQLLQISAVNYPGGLQQGDRIVLFYFTRLTVPGIAAVKNPEVKITQITNVRNNEEVKLVVYNSSGTSVFNQTRVLPKGISGNRDLGFTISVPEPGSYYYQLQAIREYPLISNDMIKTETSTEKIPFRMTPATFYSKAATNVSRYGTGKGY